MMRILIVEDEVIIARFVEMHLRSGFDCEVMIVLHPGEVEQAVRSFAPHILLCDINLGAGSSGIEVVRTLREKVLKFELIYITSYHQMEMVKEAADTDPANYLVKPIDENQLLAAVLLASKRYSPEGAAHQQGLKELLDAGLSPAEMQVLQLVAENKSTQEIAELLHASPFTIKNRRNAICRKLQLEQKNNALLQWALRNRHLLDSNGAF